MNNINNMIVVLRGISCPIARANKAVELADGQADEVRDVLFKYADVVESTLDFSDLAQQLHDGLEFQCTEVESELREGSAIENQIIQFVCGRHVAWELSISDYLGRWQFFQTPGAVRAECLYKREKKTLKIRLPKRIDISSSIHGVESKLSEDGLWIITTIPNVVLHHKSVNPHAWLERTWEAFCYHCEGVSEDLIWFSNNMDQILDEDDDLIF